MAERGRPRGLTGRAAVRARVSHEDAEWLAKRLPSMRNLDARLQAVIRSLKEGDDPALRATRVAEELFDVQRAFEKTAIELRKRSLQLEAAQKTIQHLNGRVLALGGTLGPRGLRDRKLPEWTGPEEP
jgi:hypothetical protein